MEQFFTGALTYLQKNFVDIAVYTAIGIVFLCGLFKCVLPLRGARHCLNRARRTLDKLPSREAKRPVWQNELFMGQKLQGAWRDFLHNFEALDARGMTCDVRDYINDDTVIYGVSAIPLSEMVPGLLTSIGILGTFIGLVRGLGGLDVSDAAKTMQSIPQMIGGMTFAFSTSIAGVACSLVFNILNRSAQSSTVRAMDAFTESFGDLVMQPVQSTTRAECQRQDQLEALQQMSTLPGQMAQSVSAALEHTMVPISRAMNNFIIGQTQTQVEGLGMVVNRFVEQMNAALSGQLLQLGKTLSQVNQSQQISGEALSGALQSSAEMMNSLAQMQQVTGQITGRFDEYLAHLDESRSRQDAFCVAGEEIVDALSRSSREQIALLEEIKKAQTVLAQQSEEYALRSKQTMQRICDRADETSKNTGKTAESMLSSAQLLKDSYVSFAENITVGLSRTMGMLDESMTGLVKRMGDSLASMNASPDGQDGQMIKKLSALEQMLSDIKRILSEKE